MNEILADKLKIISNDELLLQAIGEVFKEVIGEQTPVLSEVDDTRLGQKYRAYISATTMLDAGLRKIASLRVDKKQNIIFNKAK